MLIGVNILSSLRLGQRYAAHEQLLCRREHGRVFGRWLELYVLNVVFFRSCPHRSTVQSPTRRLILCDACKDPEGVCRGAIIPISLIV